jgi:GINS complex subunit 3
MTSGYLDIDEILSEEERMPCKFSLDGKNLGFLNSASDSNDLEEGSKVELPLWLSKPLREKNMIEIELPKHYGIRIREEINAGALAVKLREYSYYYFEVGLQLSKITKDDDLKRTLRTAFAGERYKSLMGRALSKYIYFILQI